MARARPWRTASSPQPCARRRRTARRCRARPPSGRPATARRPAGAAAGRARPRRPARRARGPRARRATGRRPRRRPAAASACSAARSEYDTARSTSSGPAAAKWRARLDEERVEVVAVARLDRLADAAVEARAAGGGQVLLERLAQQRVGERVAPGHARGLDQDARAHGGVEGVEQLVLGHVDDALEHRQLELAADQRRDLKHALRALGQPRDAALDHVAQAVGHREAAALAAVARVAALLQVAHELLDEERVAVGLVADRLHGRVRRRLAVRVAHQRGHLVQVEALEVQPRQRAVALQVGQRLEQRVAGRQLVVAVGAEQQHRRVAQRARPAGAAAAATSGRPSAGRRGSAAAATRAASRSASLMTAANRRLRSVSGSLDGGARQVGDADAQVGQQAGQVGAVVGEQRAQLGVGRADRGSRRACGSRGRTGTAPPRRSARTGR